MFAAFKSVSSWLYGNKLDKYAPNLSMAKGPWEYLAC